MNKRILAVLIYSVSLSGVLSAQRKNHDIVRLPEGRQIISHPASKTITPSQGTATVGNLQLIAGNLSQYPLGVYFCCYGQTISGPRSFFGQFWAAVPFTPATNISVYQVQAAVTWDGFNAQNRVIMSIAQDSGGLPGATIQELPISNLPVFGTCCALAVATRNVGIPLIAGKQYWLVAGTNLANQMFEGGWDFNSTDMRSLPWATQSGGNWGTISFIQPGFAVLGK